MIALVRKIFHSTAKLVLVIVLLLNMCQNIIAQEFEWVYTIPNLMEESDQYRQSGIRHLITNSNNEIYAYGKHTGIHDFGNQIYSGFQSNFIAKLDDDKNLLWVKKIPVLINTLWSINRTGAGGLALDADENLVIAGVFITNQTNTTVNLDPNNNPINAHENLSTSTQYSFVLRIDAQGNYINSIVFKNIYIENILIDHNNEIIIIGSTTTSENIGSFIWQQAYVCKLNSDLNTVWEKTYNNNNNHSAFFTIGIDNLNNIYCQGTFLNNFTFGVTTLENSSSEFICKILPNGNELWINELNTSPSIHNINSAPVLANRKILLDEFDNLYFYSTYLGAHSFHFNNIIISDLPISSTSTPRSVLFKMDTDGNHIWNSPIYGDGAASIINFCISDLGEPIAIVDSGTLDITYGDDVLLEANGVESFLLKINPQGELIDYKKIDAYTLGITFNSDNNIFLFGSINKPTDFNLHPFNEYMVYTSTYINSLGNSVQEPIGFVLKLTPCDVEPLFLDSYEFCIVNNPNPTIGDIEPNDFNTKWYSSANSTTPLDDSFPITNGATYFIEKITENCPTLMRQPVLMTILPAPEPPIVDSVQPCYFENMKLADVHIIGENLTFYDSFTSNSSINDDLPLNPNFTYYVTQTINECESERVAFSFPDLFGSVPIEQTALFCKSGNHEYGFVNLSEHNHLFIPQNNSEFAFTFSYYSTLDDALQDENPITNFQNHQATHNASVFVRILSQEFSCYKIAKLVLMLSMPPVIQEVKIEDWTDTDNSITIFPYDENYMYSLDGIMYQPSNHFQNLEIGQYQLYVKDKGDCNEVTENVFLLSYPKFFTPNGDGFNDQWRIKFSQFQFLVDVEIYDRYGKLIVFFDKDSTGWDGTLAGVELPATDYWFKVIRISDRKIIYRGHFALVR